MNQRPSPPPPPWRRRSPAAALLLLTLGVLGCGGGMDKAPPPKAAVPVEVGEVGQRDVARLSRGVGTVQPLSSVVVRAQVDGILRELRFKEGQTVARGDVLAVIDDRAIAAATAQARAGRAQSEAQLALARLDLDRYRNLLPDAAISRQTVDQQEALVHQLEATVQADAATLAAADVSLSFTRIEAPISGRVGLRRVDAGNLVRASDAAGIVSITQLDPISVLFALPQDQLPRIHALLASPQAAQVTAFDRDAGVALAVGTLATMDNQIDPATGTLALRAEFPNPDGALWPGQFVAIELQTDVSRGATVVPSRAVRRGPEGPFLFRVEDEIARVVPVEVLHEDDAFTAVGPSVAPGDTVVVDGYSRLTDGARIKVIEDAAQADGAAAPGGEGGTPAAPPAGAR